MPRLLLRVSPSGGPQQLQKRPLPLGPASAETQIPFPTPNCRCLLCEKWRARGAVRTCFAAAPGSGPSSSTRASPAPRQRPSVGNPNQQHRRRFGLASRPRPRTHAGPNRCPTDPPSPSAAVPAAWSRALCTVDPASSCSPLALQQPDLSLRTLARSPHSNPPLSQARPKERVHAPWNPQIDSRNTRSNTSTNLLNTPNSKAPLPTSTPSGQWQTQRRCLTPSAQTDPLAPSVLSYILCRRPACRSLARERSPNRPGTH
ncbi:hypothetical protein BDY21DRAFT_347651 [Lineolata rhizophorae]|uniref:Uncharacterized protein n=1 Tax=Lineolata rhizophorae TaxID=578093 RepID=A0A6A6NZA8_9PEZI|nr:hypothetical protein BDY21DRAFT_347651 [Lineolata rhizophorae]